MVNAHSHLELSYMKGLIPPGGGMAGFAAGMRATRESIPSDERVKYADYQDARMWQEGVAAVADICNGDNTFGVKRRSGVKYHSFIEVFGLNVSSAENARQLAAKACGEGLSADITPHSTYSLNEAGFRDSSRGEGPLSIHFMESTEEQELFDGGGRLRKWYDSLGIQTDFTDGRYASPGERIIANIASDHRIMLIHNTFVSESDAKALAAHFGANLTWVICPRSNEYITGQLPSVGLLLGTGANVAVGTDSLASNTSLSLIDELKELRDTDLFDLLHMATLAGARALGLENELGALEVGKKPGVVLLEGADLTRMTLTPQASTRRII